MKKSVNLPPKSINDTPDNTIVVLIASMIVFGIIATGYAMFITSTYTTSTEIIQVKYTSASGSAIVDMCGHPIKHSSRLANNQINLSDVYEVTINNSMFGEEITNFKLLDKEKYLENCN